MTLYASTIILLGSLVSGFAAGVETCQAVPVILISCDTLRADHVGCYGYSRETTPNLDAFSRDAVLFEKAYTPESWTLTAHMTMLTGLYPLHHGATANAPLPTETPTLAQRLVPLGYRCAGFTGHGWQFLARRGFDRGFERYDIPDGQRNIDETATLVSQWLDSLASEMRLFLFFHNFDLHSRFGGSFPRTYGVEAEGFSIFGRSNDPPVRFERAGPGPRFTRFLLAANSGEVTPTAEEIEYLKDCYDNAIRYVDNRVGRFMQDLKARGIYDNALVIITADHGEAFGEHNNFLHLDIYEENLHVPLLVKFPGGKHAGTRSDIPVNLMDLVPTVLEVLKQPQPDGLDGVSLAAVLEKRTEHPRVQFHHRLNQQAVRSDSLKLLHDAQAGTWALYDLVADPVEHSDCSFAQPEQCAKLKGLLQDCFATRESGWQIDLERAETPWLVEIALVAEPGSRIKKISMLQGDRSGEELVQQESETARVKVNLSKTVTHEHITVETEPTLASLSLMINTPQPFATNCPCEKTAEQQWKVLLKKDDSEKATLREPPSGSPRITARYVPPGDKERSEERNLNAEQTEALRALGYLK